MNRVKSNPEQDPAVKAPTTSASDSIGHLTHPKYRADIDGLRAVAILSVVGFHAFPKLIHGGFIGVDIFFVVSGFLISTILFGSLEKDSFSFVEFYSRRIRRIFPGLIVVLIAAFTAGWFLLLADEYKQFGSDVWPEEPASSPISFCGKRAAISTMRRKQNLYFIYGLWGLKNSSTLFGLCCCGPAGKESSICL